MHSHNTLTMNLNNSIEIMSGTEDQEDVSFFKIS